MDATCEELKYHLSGTALPIVTHRSTYIIDHSFFGATQWPKLSTRVFRYGDNMCVFLRCTTTLKIHLLSNLYFDFCD